jgi:hypothetical protein
MINIPLYHLIVYWVSSITLAMIAGIGWSAYIVERKKRLKRVFAFCPFIKKKNSTTIVGEPAYEKDNEPQNITIKNECRCCISNFCDYWIHKGK